MLQRSAFGNYKVDLISYPAELCHLLTIIYIYLSMYVHIVFMCRLLYFLEFVSILSLFKSSKRSPTGSVRKVREYSPRSRYSWDTGVARLNNVGIVCYGNKNYGVGERDSQGLLTVSQYCATGSNSDIQLAKWITRAHAHTHAVGDCVSV